MICRSKYPINPTTAPGNPGAGYSLEPGNPILNRQIDEVSSNNSLLKKRNSRRRFLLPVKAMALVVILLFSVVAGQAATYYLTTAGAGAAQTASNWNNGGVEGGGTPASNFITSGDIFIISTGQAATFASNTATTFAAGVTLQVDGSFTIGTGVKNTATSVTVNGTIIFTNSSSTQYIIIASSGNGSVDFTLGSGATLITNNSNGVIGASCSIGVVPTRNASVTLDPGANYEFNGATQATTGLPATVNNLTFSGSGTKTLGASTTMTGVLTVKGGVTLSLGSSTLGSPTSVVLENGPTASTISGSGALTLAGNVTVNNVGGAGIGASISCPVVLGTDVTFTVAVETNAAPDLTVSGIISGSHGITKLGFGTMVLSGANTYTGPTNISAGTLKLEASSTVSTSGPLGTTATGTTVASGAVLDLNGFSLTSAATEPIALNGTGLTAAPAGALTNTGGNASYSGAITLGSSSTIQATASGTLTCSGNVTGSFDLTLDGATGSTGTISGIISTPTSVTKAGDGTWIVSGANTYTGATTISAGTLKLGAAGVISDLSAVSVTGTLDLNGNNETIGSLAGAGTVTSSASGTLTLTTGGDGTSTTFSGIIQNGSATTVGLTKVGAGTMILSGANTYTGLTTISAGTLQVGAGSTAGVIAAGSAITNNGNLIFNRTDSYGQNYSQVISGTGALTENGTGGTLTLSGANTYTGLTTITSGTLKLGNAAALGGTANGTSITSGAVLDLNGINYSAAEPLTVNGTGISSGGSVINSNATGATYAGLITLGSASSIIGGSGTITISNTGTITGATFGLTLGGAQGGTLASILGTTSGTLTKQDAGTWTLSGANTYTGLTTISAGTLKLGNAAALGGTANGTSITSGAVLDLNGIYYSTAEPLTVNGTGISSGGAVINSNATGATYAGLITLGSASSIIGGSGTITISNTGTITGATFGLTLGGAQGGTLASILGTTSGTLTKQDAGTWTLSGANTYTGATTVNAGTLKAGVATQAFGVTSAVTLANTAGVVLDISGYDNTIGSLTGGGATGGNVTLGSNTLTAGSDNTSPAAYAGVISGTGSLIKTGTGVITLSGANAFTGGLTGSAGTLQLGASGVLVDALPVTLSGGILNTTPGYTETVGTLALTNNSTIALGTGTLTFAASNAISWISIKMLTITGWAGDWDGTSGSAGKIFVGSGTGGLTAAQLSQIKFSDGTNTYSAIQLSTGEVVPIGYITTGTISGSPFCSGSSANVPFIYQKAANYTGSTTFTAQLSDASGSFSSPVDLQTVAGDASGSQSISVTIPLTTASGTGYRIRIISDYPSATGGTIGTDNGTNLTINGSPDVTTTGTIAAVCYNTESQTTTLDYSASTNSPVSYSIDWDATANSAGLADQGSTSYIFASGGGTISSIAITAGTSAGTYSGTLTATNVSGCTDALAVNVTVNPNAAIVLTSGAGTDDQTICVNSAITNITYSITGGGTGGGVTGLPDGVSGSYSLGVWTISGTPTETGTFEYTVTTTGTCEQTSAAGTISVNAGPVVSAPATLFIGESKTLSPTVGGTWVSNSPSIATTTSNGTITGVSAGTVNFTFTNLSGCSNTTSDVTVSASADLSVIKTALTTNIVNNSDVIYQITVTNNGPSSAESVYIIDTIFASYFNVSGSTPQYSTDPSPYSWIDMTSIGSDYRVNYSVGTLTSGSTATIYIRALVESAVTTIVNEAHTTSSTADPDSDNNQYTIQSSPGANADIEIIKSVSPTSANAGETVVYTLAYMNNTEGTNPTNVIIEDEFNPAIFGTVQYSTVSSTGPWTEWTGLLNVGTLAYSTSPTNLYLSAPVLSSVTPATVGNTATIRSDFNETVPGDNTSSCNLTVTCNSDLSVVNTVTTDPVLSGEPITYQIVVTNNGPTNATGVSLADSPPAALSGVQYSLDNGGSWDSWSSPLSIGSMVSGSSITVLLRGTLSVDQCTTFTNTATVSSTSNDSNSANNSASADAISTNAGLSAVAISPTGSQTFCYGESGSEVTASETGGGTITGRQWGKRSTPGGSITTIIGATSATFTPTSANLGAGTWYVVCTSTPTCGSAITSNEVTVTVNSEINLPAPPSTLLIGESKTLSPTVGGSW
ncbi:autotransporter-associated beta strand repeat-containing protein, partial [Bacteroidota bacterium]